MPVDVGGVSLAQCGAGVIEVRRSASKGAVVRSSGIGSEPSQPGTAGCRRRPRLPSTEVVTIAARGTRTEGHRRVDGE